MIIYLCSHIILLIKFILFFFVKLLLLSNYLAKIILIVVIILILFLLNNYPRKRFKTLSELKRYKINLIMKYAIKTNMDHFYNLAIIFLAFCFSFIVIFILRLLNKDRNINIIAKYNFIISLIKNITIAENIINIILFILLFILYIIILIRLIKYFKYQIIRRHLYIIGGVMEIPDKNNWYQLKFFHEFLLKYCLNKVNISNLIRLLYIKSYFQYKHKTYKGNIEEISYTERIEYFMQSPVDPTFICYKYPYIEKIFWQIFTKWHYMILLLAILYDLYYNNYQLTHVFNILPWTFFYDLYIRISYFVDGLWLPHDEFIHTILYAKTIEIWDKNTLLIDGEFYDYNRIKLIYNTYMVKGFVKDTEHL